MKTLEMQDIPKASPAFEPQHRFPGDSVPPGNRFHVRSASRSQLEYSALPKTPPRAVGSENAHPGPELWVPILILLAFSVAAYFLFIAKATGTWPFGQ
jgi:hypothetical protein